MKYNPSLKCGMFILAFLLLLGGISSIYLTRAQNRTGANDALPSGDWSLSSGLYSKPDYKPSPVELMSVTTDAAKGLTTNKAKLVNHSPKTADAVKFRWILFKTQDPETILLEGITPFVNVHLLPGEDRSIEFPIVSFAKIYKPLLKDGKLEGQYEIEILVSEILYQDGSKWKLGDTSVIISHAPKY